jgi:DNA-binding CsgD family transcriptional regulator
VNPGYHPAVTASDVLAQVVPGVTHGVLVTEASCRPLPGLAAHPVLDATSPALDVARRLADVVFASFLAVHDDHLVRLHVFANLGDDAEPGARVLLLSPSGVVSGLTRRELQVLGLVVEGRSNQVIASALRIAPRTAAAHVEHILDKLHCECRCAAAVWAVREGSYIPSALVPGTRIRGA